MLKKLSKSLDFMENTLVTIAAFLLILSILSVVLEVLTRYFFNTSMAWVMESNEYILLYLPFLVSAWLLRNNDHITLDILEKSLSPLNKICLNIVVAILGIGICGILTWYGYLTTVDFYQRGVHSYTVLEIPQVYVVISIPLGSLVMTFEFIRKLYKEMVLLKSLNNKIALSKEDINKSQTG